ncbi:hypothetical protein [Endozoicomonas arenosclerae]|uniref:hypothetical protein n=1 Tax=Endozoicomonas arenosclerae TaxID=1633495 RepID=UPI00078490D0|nr:hypothetical protein [Endozoicomonas arenosclerae]
MESIASQLNNVEFQSILQQLGLAFAGPEYIPMLVLNKVLKKINYDLRRFAELLLEAWGGKFSKRYKKLLDPKRLRRAQRKRGRLAEGCNQGARPDVM